MKIDQIIISRSVRVNTGNYEGTEHFVSIRADLDDVGLGLLTDEELDVEARKLNKQVELTMLRQLVRSYKVRGVKNMQDPKKIAVHHGLTYLLPKEE